MDWFLYDNGLGHERVKKARTLSCLILCMCVRGCGVRGGAWGGGIKCTREKLSRFPKMGEGGIFSSFSYNT